MGFSRPGANPTTSKLTATAPALEQAKAVFFKAEENNFVYKTHQVGSGIVTNDRRIGFNPTTTPACVCFFYVSTWTTLILS
jgi:hypothetical protein